MCKNKNYLLIPTWLSFPPQSLYATYIHILYSIVGNIGRNLVDEPKIAKALADFSFVVQYGIAIHIILCECEILMDFNLVVS